MRIATWNVNSLKVRLPHVLAWLAERKPDVLCLQETKLEDVNFPVKALLEAGYQSCFSGQKTYNGVAILSRTAAVSVQAGIPGFDDPQKRLIAGTVDGVRVVCVYVPNGESVESEKYAYKLKWLGALEGWLRSELIACSRLVVLGDFNIAPDDRDVYDPEDWRGKVLFSEQEHKAFDGLVALGLADAFRLFDQPERSYTWWDYRMNAFRRKMGLRIDHVLLSGPLSKACSACSIDPGPRQQERPSDHAPVFVDFDANAT